MKCFCWLIVTTNRIWVALDWPQRARGEHWYRQTGSSELWYEPVIYTTMPLWFFLEEDRDRLVLTFHWIQRYVDCGVGCLRVTPGLVYNSSPAAARASQACIDFYPLCPFKKLLQICLVCASVGKFQKALMIQCHVSFSTLRVISTKECVTVFLQLNCNCCNMFVWQNCDGAGMIGLVSGELNEESPCKWYKYYMAHPSWNIRDDQQLIFHFGLVICTGHDNALFVTAGFEGYARKLSRI